MILRWLYCDLDGTLTTTPDAPNGPVRQDVIDKLRGLIAQGVRVVLWSANGDAYCAAFAKRHGIAAHACLRKPDLIVDDNLGIRPRQSMGVITPEQFVGGDWPALVNIGHAEAGLP